MVMAMIHPTEPKVESLSPKKLKILALLSEHGFMTMQEVCEIYGCRSWGFRAMKRLVEGGLVTPFPTQMFPKKAFALTGAGWQMVRGWGRLRARQMWCMENYSPQIFFHSLACLRCRLILEKFPNVSDWMPEALLPRRRDEKCLDAEFDYGDRHVGLEVELTLKSPERRSGVLAQLDAREDLFRVLWAYRERSIAQFIREDLLQGHLANPEKHFFVDLDELFSGRQEATWYDLYGRVAQR